MAAAVRLGYVDVEHGQLHVAQAGAGEPVLLLHQTPRSWDEYRDVLPLLAAGGLRGIALDTPGFGASPPLPGEATIEGWAAAAGAALDALGIARATVVGHHTGGAIAIELAAARPELVRRLVLSSSPWIDEDARRARAGKRSIDDVEPGGGGEHLLELWRGRAPHYPPQRPDLLERFVRDALSAGELRSDGHRAVDQYRMEERIALVRAPALLISAPDDAFSSPHVSPLAAALPGSRTVELAGGRVPLPDQLPDDFAAAVIDFVRAPVA